MCDDKDILETVLKTLSGCQLPPHRGPPCRLRSGGLTMGTMSLPRGGGKTCQSAAYTQEGLPRHVLPLEGRGRPGIPRVGTASGGAGGRKRWQLTADQAARHVSTNRRAEEKPEGHEGTRDGLTPHACAAQGRYPCRRRAACVSLTLTLVALSWA